ncbi:hypothetical protein FISHEDRAFT_62403 [Fistulina hepatica ATCC 64428]|nr:hypothetical protein FISHEDRAFT_62403 [Fistulina hepatica ATCC 64428]
MFAHIWISSCLSSMPMFRLHCLIFPVLSCQAKYNDATVVLGLLAFELPVLRPLSKSTFERRFMARQSIVCRSVGATEVITVSLEILPERKFPVIKMSIQSPEGRRKPETPTLSQLPLFVFCMYMIVTIFFRGCQAPHWMQLQLRSQASTLKSKRLFPNGRLNSGDGHCVDGKACSKLVDAQMFCDSDAARYPVISQPRFCLQVDADVSYVTAIFLVFLERTKHAYRLTSLGRYICQRRYSSWIVTARQGTKTCLTSDQPSSMDDDEKVDGILQVPKMRLSSTRQEVDAMTRVLALPTGMRRWTAATLALDGNLALPTRFQSSWTSGGDSQTSIDEKLPFQGPALAGCGSYSNDGMVVQVWAKASHPVTNQMPATRAESIFRMFERRFVPPFAVVFPVASARSEVAVPKIDAMARQVVKAALFEIGRRLVNVVDICRGSRNQMRRREQQQEQQSITMATSTTSLLVFHITNVVASSMLAEDRRVRCWAPLRLLDLPVEILTIIVEYCALDMPSLASVRRCHPLLRKFTNLLSVRRQPLLISHADIMAFDFLKILRERVSLSKQYSHVVELYTWCQLSPLDLDIGLFPQILLNFSSLRELRLHVPVYVLEHFAEVDADHVRLDNLEVLDIEVVVCPFQPDVPWVRPIDVFRNAHALRHVTVVIPRDDVTLSVDTRGLLPFPTDNLETIISRSFYDCLDLYEIMASAPKICLVIAEAIHMGGLGEEWRESVEFKELDTLETLKLTFEGVVPLDMEAAAVMLMRRFSFPRLKHLALTNVPVQKRQTQPIFQNFAQSSFVELEDLSLNYTNLELDNRPVMASLRRLRRLFVSRTSFVDLENGFPTSGAMNADVLMMMAADHCAPALELLMVEERYHPGYVGAEGDGDDFDGELNTFVHARRDTLRDLVFFFDEGSIAYDIAKSIRAIIPHANLTAADIVGLVI